MVSDLNLGVKEHPVSHDGEVIGQVLNTLSGPLPEALLKDQ